MGDVHEIAQEVGPGCRVVDIDPAAVLHSQAILDGVPHALAVRADLRHPRHILHDPQVRDLLDLRRPVAVLLVACLHFVPDADDPYGVVGHLRDAMAPGGWLAISHGSPADGDRRADEAVAREAYARSDNPLSLRTAEQIDRSSPARS